MPKPTLKKGPASKYAAPGEIILEFNNGKTGAEYKGGLISLRNMDPSKALIVEIYNQDHGVIVYNTPQKRPKGGKVPS